MQLKTLTQRADALDRAGARAVEPAVRHWLADWPVTCQTLETVDKGVRRETAPPANRDIDRMACAAMFDTASPDSVVRQLAYEKRWSR